MKRSQAIGWVVALALVLCAGQQARASSGSLAEYYFSEAEYYLSVAYSQTHNTNAYDAYNDAYYAFFYAGFAMRYDNTGYFYYAYLNGSGGINYALNAYFQTRNLNAYYASEYLQLGCEYAWQAYEGH